MQPGSFFCFVPKCVSLVQNITSDADACCRKGAVTSWLPFCKTSQRGIYRKLNAILKKTAEEGEDDGVGERLPPGLDESNLFYCTHVDPERHQTSLVYPGAGATVRSGLLELTHHLSRKEPNVYAAEKAFIVLRGYVSNLDDLCARMGRFSPFAAKGTVVENDDGSELTIGDLTARVLLHLYLGDKAKDPLLVLSELQGHYAFVIYDSEERSVFAARDASGKQPLYYTTDHEKGMSLSSVPLTEVEMWREVPPGHYLYGRHPQLMQFALTPDQLTARWSLDLDDETEFYSSLDSADPETRRGWSLGRVDTFRHRMSSPITYHEYLDPHRAHTL